MSMGLRWVAPDKPGNDNEAQPFHSVIAGLVPATHARCKHQCVAYLVSELSSWSELSQNLLAVSKGLHFDGKRSN